MSGDRVDERARRGRDAGEAAEQIERRALAGEHRARAARDFGDDCRPLRRASPSSRRRWRSRRRGRAGEKRAAAASHSGDDAGVCARRSRVAPAVRADDRVGREIAAAAEVFEQRRANERLGERAQATLRSRVNERFAKASSVCGIVAAVVAAAAFVTRERGFGDETSDDEQIAQIVRAAVQRASRDPRCARSASRRPASLRIKSDVRVHDVAQDRSSPAPDVPARARARRPALTGRSRAAGWRAGSRVGDVGRDARAVNERFEQRIARKPVCAVHARCARLAAGPQSPAATCVPTRRRRCRP